MPLLGDAGQPGPLGNPIQKPGLWHLGKGYDHRSVMAPSAHTGLAHHGLRVQFQSLLTLLLCLLAEPPS
jgi:hypothetical protein